MKTINIGFSPKTVNLENGLFLHFYYANNKGRGADNCSIIKTTNPQRLGNEKSQINDDGTISNTRTSSWAGNVNFSNAVQEKLGLN